jgi:predicted anti-sigma-YlaC factor YlaD
MDCARAEELFSDHLDGTLHALLGAELEQHLEACASCRELRLALALVVDALREAPELPVPRGLAERVAQAALLAGRRATPAMPFWLQAAAAVLALALTGLVVAIGPSGSAGRVGRVKQWTVHTGVYIAERKDRFVEDIRLIRVVVGTAFEGRLDRVNDRVDDYKRLLEKRKNSQSQPQDEKKTNDSPRNFFVPNSDEMRLVHANERQRRRLEETTRRSTL